MRSAHEPDSSTDGAMRMTKGLILVEGERPLSHASILVWPNTAATSDPLRVVFDRKELTILLGIYGRKVAAGEWRDYAIDFMKDRAVFSVFRRSTEYPLYRIEKNPKLARRQGPYAVLTAAGQVLKRGHELERVIRILEKPVSLVSGS